MGWCSGLSKVNLINFPGLVLFKVRKAKEKGLEGRIRREGKGYYLPEKTQERLGFTRRLVPYLKTLDQVLLASEKGKGPFNTKGFRLEPQGKTKGFQPSNFH